MAGPACLQQQVAAVSGISGSSSSRSSRSLLNRALPCAVAFPSLVFSSSKRRSNLSVKFHEFRGSALSQQVAESTSETVSDLNVVEAAHSRSFEGIQTEQELRLAIAKEVESGRLPERAGLGMEELYRNYRDAVISSGVENPVDVSVRVIATVLDRILLQFETPFTFTNYHPRMMEPYDYYTFGQNYVRPLIDYRNSYLGNLKVFDEIEKNLKEGHNVILLANHQTEADPAVMALLLEHSHPYLAENLIYVAGDRVVLDPFCKPFSMGRNLLCVYSKKHINDVPELAKMKARENQKTLIKMTMLLKKGGQLLWVAPSGGRDRPDPETNEWVPAAFDPSSVENMRRLAEAVRVPSHIHALSLLCYEIMPPPVQVEKALGERRAVGFSGVGLGVSERLDFDSIVSQESDPSKARKACTDMAWNKVNEMYNVLKAGIYGDKGCDASSSSLRLAQPWRE